MAIEDPLPVFSRWFADAKQAYPDEPNAMVVSTVGAGNRPSSRVVLLKSFDDRGFVFYTNLTSRKGKELAQNPHLALCFYWTKLERQVRIEGEASTVDPAEADAYFASRPRVSQIGAWASRQSEALSTKEELDREVERVEKLYSNRPVPRPPFWSGVRVRPARIEFWTARPGRLHERIVYRWSNGGWERGLLFP